jgi:hypothetical protein
MGEAIDPALLVNMTLKQPPPEEYSNFDNPETLKPQGEIGMIFCMVIGAVFIVLRFHVKVWITKMYDWDDGKLLLTWNLDKDAQTC